MHNQNTEPAKSSSCLPPLVVDLDGTLLCTDTLWEGVFSMLRQNPWKIFLLPIWLFRGKLYLKKKLAPYCILDAELFPQNQSVVSELQSACAENRSVCLATAAYGPVAQKVGEQFPFFSEIFASTDTVNLKGQHKADFLVSRFDEKQFDYIGDSFADLPVWRSAKTAIVVSKNKRLVKAAKAVNAEIKELPGPNSTWKACGAVLRVRQWVKNILVFVPMMLAHTFNAATLLQAFVAFLSFSFCASAIYVINDLHDLPNDRRHLTKKYRPFASGTVPLSAGVVLFVTAALLSVFFAFLLPGTFFICLASYFCLTTAYTLYFKRCLFMDVIVLACLYVLRLVSGAVAIHIGLSHWLLAFGLFAFLGLALLKRIGDLIQLVEVDTLHGRAYASTDIPILEMMAACSAFAAVVVVAFYIDSLQAVALYSRPALLWPCCLIFIYWFGRLLILTHRGRMGDDPVSFSVADIASRICFAASLALVLLAI